MKIIRRICLLYFLFGLILLSCNQQKSEWQGTIEEVGGVTIIKNPTKATRVDAGRIRKLKAEAILTGAEDSYYFKAPENLQIASDGSFLVKDFEQLLKFSPQGKFETNLFKKGRGPGEVSSSYAYQYFIYKDEILIYGDGRIRRFNLGGNLIEDKKTDKNIRFPLAVSENWIVTFRQIPPPVSQRNLKIMDIENIVVVWNTHEKAEKRFVFPTETFLGPQQWFSWAAFRWATNHKTGQIFISNTTNYEVKQLDINQEKIVRHITREYEKVKYDLTELDLEFNRKFNMPKRQYKDDVLGLFVNRDFLWIQTSTENEDSEILIDIFDNQGMYVDCFYLKMNGDIMAVSEELVFVKETLTGGNIQIVKYRILDK